jgi:hypothetical protein
MVVVGGYGGGIVNDCTVLDTYKLPYGACWFRAKLEGQAPRPKYGHTSVSFAPVIYFVCLSS